MAEKWIQGAVKHPGAFTKKAKAAGEGVQEFANQVKANPEKYSTQTKRQANLAKTFNKMNKGKKKKSDKEQIKDKARKALKDHFNFVPKE